MNRINLIVELIKMSSALQCEHITYKIEGDRVAVVCTNDKNIFTATELCVILHSFSMYFNTDEKGIVTLNIF